MRKEIKEILDSKTGLSSGNEKRCFKCGELKPIDCFYKHPQMADGRLNKCKDCTKQDTRQNRSDKLEYYQEYDRRRGLTPERKEKNKEYGKTHPEVGNAAKRRWCDRNQNKKKASVMVNNAVRDGRLLKEPCEVCGADDVEGHHDDYSKPLSVRWLCSTHHAEHHRNEREERRQNLKTLLPV